MKYNKGFTLLEVLVAMAIVGLLIAAAAFGISAVQRNSRNTRRKEVAKTVKITVEDFYGNYGKKPADLSCDASTTPATVTVTGSGSQSMTNEVTGFESMDCTIGTPTETTEDDQDHLGLWYDDSTGNIAVTLEGGSEPWVLSGGEATTP